MNKANLLDGLTMQAEGSLLVSLMDHPKVRPFGSEHVPLGAKVVDFLDDM